jgi:hypothetical protein
MLLESGIDFWRYFTGNPAPWFQKNPAPKKKEITGPYSVPGPVETTPHR